MPLPTEAEIRAMPAGPPLDALVAEVMGLKQRDFISDNPGTFFADWYGVFVAGKRWSPSTDFGTAGQVLKRLHDAEHYCVRIFISWMAGASCTVIRWDGPEVIGRGNTPELAICHAALLAAPLPSTRKPEAPNSSSQEPPP